MKGISQADEEVIIELIDISLLFLSSDKEVREREVFLDLEFLIKRRDRSKIKIDWISS
jgi:hypothetical protein